MPERPENKLVGLVLVLLFLLLAATLFAGLSGLIRWHPAGALCRRLDFRMVQSEESQSIGGFFVMWFL